jgi:hypothetical protein
MNILFNVNSSVGHFHPIEPKLRLVEVAAYRKVFMVSKMKRKDIHISKRKLIKKASLPEPLRLEEDPFLVGTIECFPLDGHGALFLLALGPLFL